MTAAERWDEESFLRLMRDVLPEKPDGDDEPVNGRRAAEPGH